MRTLGGDGGGEGSREAAVAPGAKMALVTFPERKVTPGVQGAEHPA